MTPIGQGWSKSMITGGGFNQAVPKLPPISGCMNQSAFSPYDPSSKDGGYIPGQSKNMGMSSGLYDYPSLQAQQHMVTNPLMQDVGQPELLNNFSKMKPYDMQYPPTGMSGIMGQNMNMFNSKMHPKDSFDN